MSLNFEAITLSRQSEYNRLLAICRPKASDYSFINIWGWADIYGLQWAWESERVWIRQEIPEPAFWAPVGAWQDVDWQKILAETISNQATFIRIPETLSNIWKNQLGDQLTIEASRGHWDYLYSLLDLKELSGNRYHKKKNLLNQFVNNYSYEYQALGPDILDQARSMQTDWCVWRDCESHDVLAGENRVIAAVFDNWDDLDGVMGGALRVGGGLVAYTVAEIFDDNTVVIHFEKGNTDYKGIYQAINQIFLSHLPEGIEWVNREQDLEDEGLRKAKMSYHPREFIRKDRILFQ
ncbi:MAG: DUF2156 domain-containing protein [Desulfatirhabdiaceae bacterium]